jgi:hypothetical protein
VLALSTSASDGSSASAPRRCWPGSPRATAPRSSAAARRRCRRPAERIRRSEAAGSHRRFTIASRPCS